MCGPKRNGDAPKIERKTEGLELLQPLDSSSSELERLSSSSRGMVRATEGRGGAAEEVPRWRRDCSGTGRGLGEKLSILSSASLVSEKDEDDELARDVVSVGGLDSLPGRNVLKNMLVHKSKSCLHPPMAMSRDRCVRSL